MEEYVSLTNSYTSHCSITYDKNITMLQNACIRYEKKSETEALTNSKSSLSA